MRACLKCLCLSALALCLVLPLFTACGACKHESTEWVEESEATCSVAGWRAKICSDCSAVLEREQYTVGHEYVEGVCSMCGAAQYAEQYLKYSEITLGDVAGYEVTGRGNSTAVALEIPPLHNGKPVLSVADGAFGGDLLLTSVFVSRNVQRIGAGAFEGCTALEQITFHGQSELTAIGEGAFEGCVALEAFSFPLGVSAISDDLFKDCTALSDVVLHDGITSLGDSAFEGCAAIVYAEHEGAKYLGTENFPYLILASVIDKSVTAFTVQSGTRIIGTSAFAGCNALSTLSLPEGLLSIGSYAFAGCGSLEAVVLSESLKTIGSHAFAACISVTEIELPDGLTGIGDHAFYGCSTLSSLEMSSGIKTVGSFAFGGTALTYAQWGGGKYVGNAQNPYLVLVDAGEGITALTVHGDTRVVADGALAENVNNAALTSLHIGENVITLGKEALSGCAVLTEVTFATGDGWLVAEQYEKNAVSRDVTNAAANAEALKGAYKNYYWYRA